MVPKFFELLKIVEDHPPYFVYHASVQNRSVGKVLELRTVKVCQIGNVGRSRVASLFEIVKFFGI